MPSVGSLARAVGGTLADLEALLLPEACLGCGDYLAAVARGPGCCAVCRSRLRRIAPPVCGRCGQPGDRWVEAGATCGFCRAWPEGLAWAASSAWMDAGPARELVHGLKYAGWRVAARAMADVMVRELGGRIAAAEALVPVPLGRRRLRQRGYNQAEVLAAAVSARTGVPVRAGLLVRTRETRTQTALGPAERWTNVAAAFAAGERPAGTRVALVDDVLTTGATLAACAAALVAAGARTVGAVTFARAAVPN
jgi:ComF family protein